MTTTASRGVGVRPGRERLWLLHGHSADGNPLRLHAAELVGTAGLVLTITAAASSAALTPEPAFGSVTVPLAVAFAQAVVIVGLGHLSGAHVNPAVTLGLAVGGRFPWRLVPGYVLAQVAGAVGGAALTWAFLGTRARTVAHLGAVAPAGTSNAGQVFAVEATVTFVLVLTVVAVATDPRAVRATSAVAIGLALGAGALVSGPVSGGGINPARALGPAILTGRFPWGWVYVVAPLVGGALAVVVYDRLLRAATAPGEPAT
ncbi:MIP/aquaporin family protein [Jatrophihabitans sp. YIM 134969]